jgi:hypothetical protein
MNSLKNFALLFVLAIGTLFTLQSCSTDASADPVKMETSSPGQSKLVSSYVTDVPAQLASWPTEGTTQTPVTETIEPTPGITGVGDWFKLNWGEALGALLAIYEIIARLIPSLRSISIITRIVAILNYIVPDRAKQGGKFIDPKTVK